MLLHVTSLPNQSGPGTMGREAFDFVDWSSQAGFTIWQILPVGPTHSDHSPYLSLSAFAGAPELLNVHALQKQPWLTGTWLAEVIDDLANPTVTELTQALESNYKERPFQALPHADEFLKRNETWLRDYAQFMTIRHRQGNKPWWEWPADLAGRSPGAVMDVIGEHISYYRSCVIQQYLFEHQWAQLKTYAHQHNMLLFGDMPLYVSHDSADVWANRRYFALDEQGQPSKVAGVPPDLFSATGQIWGNPVYDWSALEHDNFRWWIDRIKRQLHLFDLLRLDHFRGLEAYWEVPGDAETAEEGTWVKAPGKQLLETIRGHLGDLPLVAEDLGYITPEVDELREAFRLPCMRVLQFGFDGNEDNPHLPENYTENTVAYTGTHDNDTVLAWFESLHDDAKQFVRKTLGITKEDSVLEAMKEALLNSRASLVMFPLQDVLGLGPGNRMNTPGTLGGNWVWQAQQAQLTTDIQHDMLRHIRTSNRKTAI